MSEEEWRKVSGWPYEVSDCGRVRNANTGRVLKPEVNDRDQERVRLYRDGESMRVFVHHLVLEAFVGERQEGREANHKNGDRRDNRTENLEWVTPKENTRHAIRSGLRSQARGEDVGGSKLTPSQIVEIRQRYFDEDVSQRELAVEYGLEQPHVSRILSGEVWSHVDGPTSDNMRGELSEDQVRDIYRRAHHGAESYSVIASDFDISKSTVSRIKQGDRWPEVTGHD